MRNSVGEWLSIFRSRGADGRELEWLCREVQGQEPIAFFDRFDHYFTEKQEDWFCEKAERLVKGEPLAYVLGFVEFLSCRIETTPQVLIPRQETEILVEKICGQLEGQQELLSQQVLWDLCCGSGCMGIAIQKRFPSLRVVASDLSKEALDLAQKNAVANGVIVEFRQGDLLQPFEGEVADYIISNPPYLSQEEYEIAEPSVRQFEPKLALLGGVKGTAFYERLAEKAPDFLRSHGQLWLEVGSTQGVLVEKLFAHPPWRHGRLCQDWAGKDRFFSVERE